MTIEIKCEQVESHAGQMKKYTYIETHAREIKHTNNMKQDISTSRNQGKQMQERRNTYKREKDRTAFTRHKASPTPTEE